MLDKAKFVSVRLDRNSLYSVPAELIEARGNTVRVRFAAGNERVVAACYVRPATNAEVLEYIEDILALKYGRAA